MKKNLFLSLFLKLNHLLHLFFAYSEVIWSYLIHNYFDESAPVYQLGICDHYSDEIPKYYNYGTVVPNVLDKNQKIVNLLEYFRKYPDSSVDIDNYENYCMKSYDYTSIFNSKFILENKFLGEKLAMQVLLSVLKTDQNYHYENVGMIYENDKLLKMSPPIDHEFSTMFLYMDDLELHKSIFKRYKDNLGDDIDSNLDIIVDKYESVCLEFLKKLDNMINDLENQSIVLSDNNYIFPFNSNNYRFGICKYKKNIPDIENNFKQYIVDINVVSELVMSEILEMSNLLKQNLIDRLENKKGKRLVR